MQNYDRKAQGYLVENYTEPLNWTSYLRVYFITLKDKDLSKVLNKFDAHKEVKSNRSQIHSFGMIKLS